MDTEAMERRDHDLRQAGTAPTQAERDRRSLLEAVARLRGGMREALTALQSDKPKPDVAIDALRHTLENG